MPAVDALVAGLAEERMDRRHPLWRFVLVDGLRDGRQVLVLVWNHALADGTACRTILRRLFSDVDPAERAAVRAAEPFRPEPVRRVRLLTDGLSALLRSLCLLPLLLWRARSRSAAADARRESASVRVPTQADTPVTRLNDAFSGRRRVARRQVPLADVRRAKDAAGTSVNDVLLAMAAGSLRARLLAADELPGPAADGERPGVGRASPPGRRPRAPVRATTSPTTSPAWPPTWPTPCPGSGSSSAVAREGRAQLDVLGPTTVVGLLDNLPAAVAEPGARLIAAQKREHRDRADYSVLLSNVRGSDAPFRFAGPAGPVVVEHLSVLGTTFDGTGLTLVGWTYGDTVELTAISDPDAEPDPAAVLDGMVAALVELGTALGVAAEGVAG